MKHMKELENIRKRYKTRKLSLQNNKHDNNIYFNYYVKSERELTYLNVLKKKFEYFKTLKLLEIGAGSGDNLLFFHRLGIPWNNIYANELLEDRGRVLKANLSSEAHVDIGDASDLNYKENFDIVFQSTVFTSILDKVFKETLAGKMFQMLKPAGIALWYDFKYDNPYNKDVKGISQKEINRLFPEAKKIDFHPVTLAPPIGRKVGKFYNLINNVFPFLKTHVIAVIYK